MRSALAMAERACLAQGGRGEAALSGRALFGLAPALLLGGPSRFPVLLDLRFGYVLVLGANHAEHRGGGIRTARHWAQLLGPAAGGSRGQQRAEAVSNSEFGGELGGPAAPAGKG